MQTPLNANPTWGDLVVDTTNAHNSVSRDVAFAIVASDDHLSLFGPLLRTGHASPSKAVYQQGETVVELTNKAGYAQGLPASSVLYGISNAVIMKPTRDRLKAENASLITISDNVSIVGPLDAIFDTAEGLETKYAGRVLKLSPAESEAYSPTTDPECS